MYLSKIRIVKILLHRPICGKVKTLNIDRDAVGNWCANFTCEIDPEPLPKSEVALGIEVALEKLNGKNMLQNHRLAKNISAAAWSQLVQYLTYKAEYAGREVVLVDPHGTSQRCSGCVTVVKKSLSVQDHSCPRCGLEINRDIKAAINILTLGLQSLGIVPRSHPVHGVE